MKKFFSLVLIVMMTFSIVACGSNTENQVENQNIIPQEKLAEESTAEEPAADWSMVDVFIEKYNEAAPTQITDISEIDVTDQASSHYRTEFRLGAFKDSVAKTGKIGDVDIDVINCGWEKDELRIYADNITSEQAAEIVEHAAPIMDPDVSSDDLQDVVDYLLGINDYHNGYFGNLCMAFNEIRGELMLRTD